MADTEHRTQPDGWLKQRAWGSSVRRNKNLSCRLASHIFPEWDLVLL